MRAAFAYVNHGRWVADCPTGCGGAELARDDEFMCRECLNAGAGRRPMPLVWPSDEDGRAIEAALAVRPVVNRNWNLNESIGALLAENVEHGLFDGESGQVAGDVGANQNVMPFLRTVARLELTA
jgi:hypothetical protein